MNVEQLIAELARETGVRLSTADPILSGVAINEILLDRALVKLDQQVKVQADRVTAASTQAVVDAKREAEALLTDAGEWSEARLKAAAETAAGMMVAHLRLEMQKMAAAKRIVAGAVWVMAILGLVILSGLTGMVLAGIR
jgi:hypothetical protein